MKRTITTLAALTAATMLLTACSGTAEQNEEDLELISSGTLTVCTEAPYPPFEFEDPEAPSGYSGFDIDLMQAIADDLDLTMVVQNVGFDALQSGIALASGQCDLAASAMIITPEREKNLDFSAPYYESNESLMAAKDSGITSIDDLAGKRVALQQATTGEEYAKQHAPEGTELVLFPSDTEMWQALQSDGVDAILQDFIVNLEHVKADDRYTIVETYSTGGQFGFAFGKDMAPNLLAAVNDSLQKMRDDGTYDALESKYFSE